MTSSEAAAMSDDSVPLPTDLAADFAPLSQADANKLSTQADTDPFLRDSLQAQEAYDRGVATATAGNEKGAVQQLLQASKLAEGTREWYLAAVSCERVGDYLQHPGTPFDLDRALRIYRRGVAAYEQCGHFAEARRLSYRIMLLKMTRGTELSLSWSQRSELMLYWIIAGFGYRPQRIMATSAALIIIYGLAYWGLNGVVAPTGEQALGLWDAVYFSGITFATVGYGDLLPAPHVRLFALTEGLVGAFMMGFFVVVMAYRLRH